MDRQETFNSPPLFCICHQKFSILSLSFLPLPLFEFFLFFMCSTIFLVSLVMSFSFRVFGVSPGIMAESSHDCHQYIVECVKLTSTWLDSSYHSQTFSSEIGRNHFWNWVALWHSRFMRGLCDLCVIEALAQLLLAVDYPHSNHILCQDLKASLPSQVFSNFPQPSIK